MLTTPWNQNIITWRHGLIDCSEVLRRHMAPRPSTSFLIILYIYLANWPFSYNLYIFSISFFIFSYFLFLFWPTGFFILFFPFISIFLLFPLEYVFVFLFLQWPEWLGSRNGSNMSISKCFVLYRPSTIRLNC